MQPDKDNIDSEEELTQKTRRRRRLLKKIIRNNRQVASDKEFQILINLDKELFAGYNAHRLGNFCIQQNRLQLAEQNLFKANDLIQKKFLFTNVYLSLGNLQLKRKNLSKACEYFQKVLSLSPHKNSKLYLNKDQVVFANRLNSFNAFSQAHDQLIKIYVETNQLQKGYAICRESLELKQEEESGVMNFADVMERLLGNRAEALSFAWKKLVEETKAKGCKELESFEPIEIHPWVRQQSKQQTEKNITILTVKLGSKYSSEHVNNLYSSIIKNTTWTIDFCCFTDDLHGINKSIKTRSLDDEWKKQWGKAVLFGQKIEGKKFYIDLDTRIIGNLDDLFGYDGEFGTIQSLRKEQETYPHWGYVSSVIIWKGNKLKEVYDKIANNFELIEKLLIKFDYWLDLTVKNADNLQKLYPGTIVYFHPDIRENLPEKCAIITSKTQSYPKT